MPSSSSAGSQGQQQGIQFPASSSAGQAGRDGSQPSDGDSGQGQQTASGDAASAASGGAGNAPNQSAGTQSRLPGDSGADGTGRDSASGSVNSGQSGTSGGTSGVLGQPGGDYSLDTLPNGGLGGDGSQSGAQAGAAVTAAERAEILDERLRRGYEDFDGFILGERERAQRESNQAGSVAIGNQGGNSQGGAVASNQPQTMPSSNGGSTAGVIGASPSVTRGSEPAENFPPPEDIPSGRDDDVVARQLREAAMNEPDPELRQALWDEYRRYTGLPVPADQGDEQ